MKSIYALLLSLLACHASLAEQATPLRIVAFNCEVLKAPGVRQGQFDRYRFDPARIAHHERVAAVIETLSPDIIGLEEVISRESVDMLLGILHDKGMTDYRGYHVENSDTYSGMDVCYITRLKPDVVEGEKIRTINSEAEDPTWRAWYSAPGYNGESPRRQSTSVSRNAVYYFTVAGHKLGFLGLHLKSNPSDEAANSKRMAESIVAQRILQSEIVRRGYEPIVMGDLNDYDAEVADGDDSRDTVTKVIRNLKDFDPKRPGDELINAAALIPRKQDRYSSNWDFNENGFDDPGDVHTMIDHILFAKDLKPFVNRAFISHCTPHDTSDHFPVVLDLLLPPVSNGTVVRGAGG
ncbi:endonuclease/exonuclease/phosphatase family protein [Pirellulimonas nuda]|uniref:endonuclease/exonuclease/phosphatase family protein n=1 Tax=Pirellulimonas nuda TaxID=2528009 RepID=UPI0018D49C65|nr:endonuclease/exonuclease/phosphatase family protein [Pirellulimonas nuda]